MIRKRISMVICLLVAVSLLAACGGTQTPTLVEGTDTVAAEPPVDRPTSQVETPPIPSATPQPTSVDEADLPEYFWWNEAAFHEIFVRSFFDSDGDGVGDFNGIIEKLDYLNDGDPTSNDDLGVKGIWLMPVFPSPSYHGYDVTDYYDVNPDYGTMQDFQRLLDEAYKRGIRVIIDMVLNHTSSQHPWFIDSQDPDSPFRDWYTWSDTNPRTIGPWGQQVWHPGATGHYYGIFWGGMPDLNYENPEVVGEMEEVMRFWLEDVGVDGFRLDGARHIVEEGDELSDTASNHEYFKGLRSFVKSINPDALLLGEVWTSNFAVASYLKGDELDLAFDFDLASAFLKSAGEERADSALSQLGFSLKLFPPGQFAPFLTNHDMNRVMSQLGGDWEKAKNAATLLLSSPGVPFMYYGEEIGMVGEKPDEKIRTPMQWSSENNAGFTTGRLWFPVNPDYPEKNVDVQSSDPDSLLNYYLDLVQLRNQHSALRTGDTFIVEKTAAEVYSILRSNEGETILVVVNLSGNPLSDYELAFAEGPLTGTYQVVPLVSEGEFPDLTANSNGGFDSYKPLPTLPGNTRLILLLQR